MSLVDERYGGPLDGAGERESTPCDALGGVECWPLNCSHMCTAVCIVVFERVFAAVKMMVATLCSALDAYVACAEWYGSVWGGRQRGQHERVQYGL